MPDALTTPAPALAKKPDQKAAPRDSLREALETIVFVVVLVFLLKQFVVEAFVIPTGSMAETLYGDQKIVTCRECGHQFPLNSNIEVEPQDERDRRPVTGYCCPNCRYRHAFTDEERRAGKVPGNSSGDRVLVHKAEYHVVDPKRGDVVVFKFPESPMTRTLSAQNYIKRLWGTGGETIAIWRGDLYVTRDLAYPADARGEGGEPLHPRPDRPEDLWKGNPMRGADYRYPNAKEAMDLFDASRRAGFPEDRPGFKLIRKSDELLEAMKRVVYDNEHQSPALAAAGTPPRWRAASADWTADNASAPKAFAHAGDGFGWVRYKHLIPEDWTGGGARPELKAGPIDNFLGYNAEFGQLDHMSRPGLLLDRNEDYKFWVGDLIVECRAKLTDPAAEVVLELSKGQDRFQAKFAGGQVALWRFGPDGGKELASRPTKAAGPGAYTLRFANVDGRLRAWVDGRRIDFGPAADYAPAAPEQFDPADTKKEGWTVRNDVEEPVGVGAKGGVEVSRLKVWRDTYFINTPYSGTTNAAATVQTYYVQPGHYLCPGDNSAQSSDSRYWGTVPERLVLGRASFVFFPLDRIGFIK